MKWTSKFINDVLTFIGEGLKESGAVIEVVSSKCCLLYEIPQYGGEKQLFGKYKNTRDAMKIADSWI